MNFTNGKMSPFQSIMSSVVVDLLSIVALDVCVGFVLYLCFVTQNLLSLLVLQLFR